MKIEPVRLQAPSTNTTQDYTFSGFGTPDACIVIAGLAGSGSDVDEIYQSIGVYDGTNTRVGSASREHNAAAASVNARSDVDSTNIVHMSNYTTDAQHRTATAAFITDGVRLTWSGTTTFQPWVIVILIGAVTGAVVGELTPSSTLDGTATETGLGITPNLIFNIQNRLNVGDVNAARCALSFGYAYDNGATIDNHCLSWQHRNLDNDGELAIDSTRVGVAPWGGATRTGAQEITSMGSGQFVSTTRDNATNPADADMLYLAIETTANITVFSSTVPTTDVAWTPLSGGSFTPEGTIMLASRSTTKDADVENDSSGFFGVYVATESAEYALGWCNEDTVDPTNCSGRTESQFFIQDDAAGTPDFTATSPSFSSGQIQYSAANAGEATSAWQVLGIAVAEQVNSEFGGTGRGVLRGVLRGVG
ncbi:MAG: hypothetical protein R3268_04980 [Acidiferrobacterales bacterium]|nr:hypothetical protein [Acidiferrobacterales bacterium]